MKSDFCKNLTSDAMQGNASHMLRFFSKSYNFLKTQPENLLSGSFLEVSRLHTPSYALAVMPQFLNQMKGFMEIQNHGKFHLYSISGCKVKKSEMFLWRWSIHEMAHFLAFLGTNSPKYCPTLLKFGPELVSMASKTLFQKIFENLNFTEIGRIQSLHFFSVFVQL